MLAPSYETIASLCILRLELSKVSWGRAEEGFNCLEKVYFSISLSLFSGEVFVDGERHELSWHRSNFFQLSGEGVIA